MAKAWRKIGEFRKLQRAKNLKVMICNKKKNVVYMEEDDHFWLPDGKYILLKGFAVDGLVTHIGSVVIYSGG